MTNFKKLITASLYQELTVIGPPVPTDDELRPYLGDRDQWAICPNNEYNRKRYGHSNFITPKQYRDAQIQALAARMTNAGIDEQSFMKVMEFIRAEPTS